ncbi:MAG TPA: translocation protein TolB, partial [Acidobacteriaceae bacterium]|nr:translocation protein TolB [Acidobacteriaceae bacterium]
MMQNLPRKSFLLSVFILVTFVASTNRLLAQDWVRTGTNLGVNKIRIAAADLKAVSTDPQTGGLKSAFDQTLYNDLRYAGIFDVVSKSMIPNVTPGSPQEIQLATWAGEPSNAAYVAFGSLAVNAGRVTVQGFL